MIKYKIFTSPAATQMGTASPSLGGAATLAPLTVIVRARDERLVE